MEYVRSPEVQLKLRGYLKEPYDAKVRLLAANVAMGKAAIWYEHCGPEPPDPTRLSYTEPHVSTYMTYESQCHSNHSEDIVRLLDGLRDFTKSSGLRLEFPSPGHTEFISIGRLKKNRFDDYFPALPRGNSLLNISRPKQTGAAG